MEITDFEVHWLEVIQSPKAPKRPKYKRTFGVVDGKVTFLPAWVAQQGHSIVLACAAFDGAHVCYDRNRAYFCAEWMAKAYPSSIPFIAHAQKMSDDYLGGAQEQRLS